jgi:hypothetical protein
MVPSGIQNFAEQLFWLRERRREDVVVALKEIDQKLALLERVLDARDLLDRKIAIADDSLEHVGEQIRRNDQGCRIAAVLTWTLGRLAMLAHQSSQPLVSEAALAGHTLVYHRHHQEQARRSDSDSADRLCDLALLTRVAGGGVRCGRHVRQAGCVYGNG